MSRAAITGTGMYVPPKIVTNHDLAKLMNTSDEWIQQRTGIQERRYVEIGVGTSELAYHASVEAIKDAGINPKDLDCIILATLSPERFFPGTGVFLQERLDVPGIPALDIRTQCTGFIYGLSIADQFIRTGMYKNILVVGAEIHSPGLDFSDRGRDTAVIFGDGAGAVVVQAVEENDPGVLSTHLHSDGRFAKELWIPYPGTLEDKWLKPERIADGDHFPKMNGKLVFVHAVKKLPEVIREALDANNLKIEDIDLIIPHQANLRINVAMADQLGIDSEKVFNNIQRYGNTTSASIPIALTEAKREGRIKSGDLIALAAFGSGFTWGAALIRW
ncbi:MAG: 3-oxoacyl-ACP synthase [Deltaproteobacteria bacterium RIFCSPHIGHO2_12_FULL_43_9]|nr:MAG: 3-oxoacyl-ACP synthase [Deltaproteobacteria bacterium RIFCSPHIGHO2_12_FULL_43_9]